MTNGLGSYASGTVSDILSRRYHGLLVAAMQAPLGRRVLLAKLDAAVRYRDAEYALSANQWHDRSISPRGDANIVSFHLDGTIPTTRYAFSDAQIERTVWMERGADTTYIRYRVLEAASPVSFALKAYIDDRDFHALTHVYDAGDTTHVEGNVASIRMRDGVGWQLAASAGSIHGAGDWYYGFFLAAENERGLEASCDLLHAATIEATIEPGASLTIVATRNVADVRDVEAALQRARDADAAALADFHSAKPHHRAAPAWIDQLALAADQFIVNRSVDDDDGKTVVAGYHWFGDWGRDTMISLAGLTLTTGRAPIARSILATFAQYLSEGMLPNRFPDSNAAPEYNTVDATLWFVDAIRDFTEATNDTTLVASIYDALSDLIEWHVRGTRFGIMVDPSDGLLRAGEPGVQLTWMDAKVGDWVVTPRMGKPVEINALWYNALRCMDGFAQALGRDASRFRELASRARAAFARFWNEETGYLFDVLDGPNGNDGSIRPNAIIALSLPFRALDQTREQRVVDRAAQCLLTPFGLRTLDPADPAYIGAYAGDVRARDGAYHEGTVWPWLIGPYMRAHLNAFGRPAPLLSQLELFATRTMQYGAGTLAEIADGNAPHEPRGCIAQAWSVAQVLSAWSHLQGANA